MIQSQQPTQVLQTLIQARETLGSLIAKQLEINYQLNFYLLSQSKLKECKKEHHNWESSPVPHNISPNKIQIASNSLEASVQKHSIKVEPKLAPQEQQENNKNDTKNIPKNYGKAILTYILKNFNQFKPFIANMNVPINDFLLHVKRNKQKVNSIADLRQMWGEANLNEPVQKILRIISYHFMRKHCLSYIFKSRVKNYGSHIKYRTKLIEGIQKPSTFTSIKEY